MTTKTTTTETRILPVKLTDKEVRERGEALAKLEGECAAVELEKKLANAGWNATIKRQRGEMSDLAQVVRNRKEDREVEVEFERDMVAKVELTRRIDTFEVVHRRPLTSLELQGELDLED